MASVNGVAAKKMLAESLPVYGAKLRLARQIPLSCERYEFNDQMRLALSAARSNRADDRLQVIRQASGLDLASDVKTQSFQARGWVEVGVDNICAAGDREVAEQTGISALLVAR